MKIVCKVIKYMVLIGVFIFAVSCIYLYYTKPIQIREIEEYKSKGRVDLDKKLTRGEIKEDVNILISNIEKTHPLFLEGESSKYKVAKENLMKICNSEMTTERFQIEVSKYLSSIEDGHTRLWWNENSILDIKWVYLEGKLVLLDENRKLTDKEVVEINDINVDDLVEGIKEIFPAENYIAENMNIAINLKSKSILKSLGVQDENQVEVTIKDKEGYSDVFTKYTRNDGSGSYEISDRKIDDDTFYIKLGACIVDNSSDIVVKDLKNAIKEGVSNVIIDVRDNAGGNSMVCDNLLEAMDMEYGSFGGTTRFSPLAQKRRGYLRSRGSINYTSNNHYKKNENINLYVINNGATFSSAEMLVTLVRDGGLGTIVGSASSNRSSHYGDVINFQLPNSNIECQVSHKKFIRPDTSKENELVLEPDIEVSFDDDPVEKTLQIIKNLK